MAHLKKVQEDRESEMVATGCAGVLSVFLLAGTASAIFSFKLGAAAGLGVLLVFTALYFFSSRSSLKKAIREAKEKDEQDALNASSTVATDK